MAAGGRKENVATKPMNSGEWSYGKCLAVGLQMQAQEARVENAKQAFDRQIEFAKQLGKTINNISENIKNAIQNFQNTLPNALKIPMEVLTNIVITPLLNLAAYFRPVFIVPTRHCESTQWLNTSLSSMVPITASCIWPEAS